MAVLMMAAPSPFKWRSNAWKNEGKVAARRGRKGKAAPTSGGGCGGATMVAGAVWVVRKKKERWREGEGSNVEEGRRKGHARNFRFNLGKLTIRSFP